MNLRGILVVDREFRIMEAINIGVVSLLMTWRTSLEIS